MTDLSAPLSSKSLGKKRALLIAIRHVHRKVESSLGNLANLEFAHRDAEELRNHLIGMYHSVTSDRPISPVPASHGYQVDDIILMMDDKSYPEHLWPTHGRIVRYFTFLVESGF